MARAWLVVVAVLLGSLLIAGVGGTGEAAPNPTRTPTPTRTRTATPTPTVAPTETPEPWDPNRHVYSVFGYRLPKSIRIKQGDVVVWKNGDRDDHELKLETPKDAYNGVIQDEFDALIPARPPPPRQGKRPAPSSFAHQFTVAGRYPYHCEIHPRMKGVVVVVAPRA